MKSEFNPLELKKINMTLERRIELKHEAAKPTKEVTIRHPSSLSVLTWWKKISRLF